MCLNLKYPEVEAKKVYGVKYFEELEYLTQNIARNKYIRNLALALNGNTLCLFQLVEKHGEILFNLIKEKVAGIEDEGQNFKNVKKKKKRKKNKGQEG